MAGIVRELMDKGVITSTTIPSGKQTVLHWIRQDLLRLPKLLHNGYYQVTEKQLNEIVQAFSMGGKGYWHWDEEVI